MAFKFEGLKIWQMSLKLTIEIGELSRDFPDVEKFALSNQMRRAADSVVLNIAEGCTGQSTIEYKKFLRYSLRSSIEVVSCLFIAKGRSYLTDDTFHKYYYAYEDLCKMINGFSKKL